LFYTHSAPSFLRVGAFIFFVTLTNQPYPPMTVKELRELLADAPDDMEVIVPNTDGYFYAASAEESGIAPMDITRGGEPTQESFFILPYGFFDEEIDEYEREIEDRWVDFSYNQFLPPSNN
jgi:hypothetical protein